MKSAKRDIIKPRQDASVPVSLSAPNAVVPVRLPPPVALSSPPSPQVAQIPDVASPQPPAVPPPPPVALPQPVAPPQPPVVPPTLPVAPPTLPVAPPAPVTPPQPPVVPPTLPVAPPALPVAPPAPVTPLTPPALPLTPPAPSVPPLISPVSARIPVPPQPAQSQTNSIDKGQPRAIIQESISVPLSNPSVSTLPKLLAPKISPPGILSLNTLGSILRGGNSTINATSSLTTPITDIIKLPLHHRRSVFGNGDPSQAPACSLGESK